MADPILLYDGVCGLCNSTVQFILAQDKHKKFRFAALQNSFGQGILTAAALPNQELSSVVLVENGRILTRSAAVFRILNLLGGIWRLLALLRVVPRTLTDHIYDFIAHRRYAWFGKYDSCQIPKAETRARFLD